MDFKIRSFKSFLAKDIIQLEVNIVKVVFLGSLILIAFVTGVDARFLLFEFNARVGCLVSLLVTEQPLQILFKFIDFVYFSGA